MSDHMQNPPAAEGRGNRRAVQIDAVREAVRRADIVTGTPVHFAPIIRVGVSRSRRFGLVVTVTVRCPFGCKRRRHVHGWPEHNPPGWRTAHCGRGVYFIPLPRKPEGARS